MKKLLLLVALIVGLNASEFTYKKSGNIKKLSYEKKSENYLFSQKKSFKDNVKVIIAFNNKEERSLLENKYNLLNGKKFFASYFIYEQESNNIIDLFKNLSNEDNVKTIHPNWNTKVIKR